MTPRPQTSCSLRPAEDGDEAFLLALYNDTRRHEDPLCRWPKAHREKFLALQYEAQKESYAKAYPGASHRIVVLNRKPVGRLLLNWTAADVRVVDISLLEAFRNKGLGGALLRSLIAEADAKSLSVSLHALDGSPALRLYRRLGFEARPSSSPGRQFLVREPSVRGSQPPP